MKVVLAAWLGTLLIAPGFAQPKNPARAAITGIDHVAFYTTDSDGVQRLYSGTLGLQAGSPIEKGETTRFFVGSQWVGYSPAPDTNSTSRLDHVAFTTTDLDALQRQLKKAGIKISQTAIRSDGSRSLFVNDPEGNRIEFVQRKASDTGSGASENAVSHRLIHAGFVVRNRDAEDRFYKDILRFHIYWHGGMQPDRTDWVAMQVPDGTDWLEYMLNQPEQLDLRRNGVMDHISLGVRDMNAAQSLLESHGWESSDSEHQQMGRDGKRQLNVFDPDHTRIELMEFKPAQKPCCSDFQGPHPSE